MTASVQQVVIQEEKNPPTPQGGEVELRTPTFDEFWDDYPDKSRSSRGKTQCIWDKLKRDDKIAAFSGLIRHAGVMRLHPGQFVLPAASVWLNQKRWLDDTPLRPPDRTSPVKLSSGAQAMLRRRQAAS